MSKPVTHKQVYRRNAFGGISNRTVCGRVSERQPDGMNIGEEVTCKFCQRLLARNPKLGVSVEINQ